MRLALNQGQKEDRLASRMEVLNKGHVVRIVGNEANPVQRGFCGGLAAGDDEARIDSLLVLVEVASLRDAKIAFAMMFFPAVPRGA